MASKPTIVEIDGHQVKLTNLDKVLYPETGFTKGEVIDYYARIAPTMLVHLRDRCTTFRRFPNGVDDKSFFEKRCPSHRPDWVETAPGPGDKGGAIDYCQLSSVASLVWAGNLAALELHTPMSRADDIDNPTMVVFDLDPGAPAGMTECAQIALMINEVLSPLDLEILPKTSGSKGMQLYVPLNTTHTQDHTRSFALVLAQTMEKHHGDLVVTRSEEGAAQGQGAHRLEPERVLQDDHLRVLATGPTASDGVDTRHVGRGRGGRFGRGVVVRGPRRARARRADG